MKIASVLTAGLLVAASVTDARAADTEMVMCEQFAIKGAMYSVEAAKELDKVFATDHHAPRNIPIEVKFSGSKQAFIHFPIVEAGTYLIYTNDPDRVMGLKHKGGEAIKATKLPAAKSCATALTGGLSAELADAKVAGPMPVAIEFGAGSGDTLQLIVSRDPIN